MTDGTHRLKDTSSRLPPRQTIFKEASPLCAPREQLDRGSAHLPVMLRRRKEASRLSNFASLSKKREAVHSDALVSYCAKPYRGAHVFSEGHEHVQRGGLHGDVERGALDELAVHLGGRGLVELEVQRTASAQLDLLETNVLAAFGTQEDVEGAR